MSSSELPYYARPDFDPSILAPSALRAILDLEGISSEGLSREECLEKFKHEMQKKANQSSHDTPRKNPSQSSSATPGTMSGFGASNIFQAKPTPAKTTPFNLNPTPAPAPAPAPASPVSPSNRALNPSSALDASLYSRPDLTPSLSTSPKPKFQPPSFSSTASSSSSSSKPYLDSNLSGIAEIEVVTKRHPSHTVEKAPIQTPSKPVKSDAKRNPDSSQELVEMDLDHTAADYSRYIYFFGLLLGLVFLLTQLFSLQMTLVGYCPSTPPTEETQLAWPLSLAAQHIPCKPCPEKATCANGHAVCKDGLTLSKAGVCKQEQKFQREKDLLFEKLAHHVADTNGAFLCDERQGHEELSEQDLWRLSENYVKDPEQREKLFRAGLKDITDRKADYELEFKRRGSELYFRSKNPRISFSCRTQLFLIKFWNEHSEHISMAVAVVAVVVTIIWRIRVISYNRRKITYAQEFIKTKLREQSKKSEPFLAVAHVRQTLMEAHPDLTTQDWNEVKRAIKNDPRIQETDRDVKGEDRAVWEWVAPDVLNS